MIAKESCLWTPTSCCRNRKMGKKILFGYQRPSLCLFGFVSWSWIGNENIYMLISTRFYVPFNSFMLLHLLLCHYTDAIMGAIASQITSLTIVYSTVCSGADQREHQSSASLAFVRGIYRGPVNSPHKGPVTRIMFPFDDVMRRSTHEVIVTWGPSQ